MFLGHIDYKAPLKSIQTRDFNTICSGVKKNTFSCFDKENMKIKKSQKNIGAVFAQRIDIVRI